MFLIFEWPFFFELTGAGNQFGTLFWRGWQPPADARGLPKGWRQWATGTVTRRPWKSRRASRSGRVSAAAGAPGRRGARTTRPARRRARAGARPRRRGTWGSTRAAVGPGAAAGRRPRTRSPHSRLPRSISGRRGGDRSATSSTRTRPRRRPAAHRLPTRPRVARGAETFARRVPLFVSFLALGVPGFERDRAAGAAPLRSPREDGDVRRGR